MNTEATQPKLNKDSIRSDIQYFIAPIIKAIDSLTSGVTKGITAEITRFFSLLMVKSNLNNALAEIRKSNNNKATDIMSALESIYTNLTTKRAHENGNGTVELLINIFVEKFISDPALLLKLYNYEDGRLFHQISDRVTLLITSRYSSYSQENKINNLNLTFFYNAVANSLKYSNKEAFDLLIEMVPHQIELGIGRISNLPLVWNQIDKIEKKVKK